LTRVLVTGAHGFLGRHAARAFARRGAEVVGLGFGEWSEGERRAFGVSHWIAADVSAGPLAEAGGGFDAIVHCAGPGSVGRSFEDPQGDRAMSVDTTAAVLEHARRACPSATVVFLSTPAVHGDRPDAPIREDDPTSPVSPYGAHKLEAEGLCRAHAERDGLAVAIVRLFSVYGPGLRKQLLWDACAKLSGGALTAEFSGTGEETRDWIHVDDAASLIVAAADARRGMAINGGSGERRTIRETLELLKAALGSRAGLVFDGRCRAGDPRHYWADVSRATALGWRPAVRLEDGIAAYAAWFRGLA
jgi:UDP-glucose 4-epimerase